MRERRERERAEARASNMENTDGNEASRDQPAPATAAEPVVAPAVSVSEEDSRFLSSLSPPVVPLRPQTPEAPANVHPTPTPRSQSQPPASLSSSSSSTPAPSFSRPTTQTPPQEDANDWNTLPALEDVSDSDDDEDNEGDDEDDEAEDRAQEPENGTQASSGPSHANEPPIASTPGVQTQAQAPRPRQNDLLPPRTIQTAHGLITLIPVPFNFPFPAGNGIGVGIQAGGNGDYLHFSSKLAEVDFISVAANANTQVPPTAGQGHGQIPTVDANANTQGECMRA